MTTPWVLRSYWRLREDYIERAADSGRHMQKVCDLMNVKLHTLSGAGGYEVGAPGSGPLASAG